MDVELNSINFCHIVPTMYLRDYASRGGSHLLLAHLVESDSSYRNYYNNLSDGKYKILDNSCFEMFKQGRPMYDSSKLVELAKLVKANCIVLSDYPKEPSKVTIEAAERLIPIFKEAGFDVFFCPQSKLGDIDDLMSAFEWAINNPLIDIIGVSILACPIALGIDEGMEDSARQSSYRLQRYLSRLEVFKELNRRNLLNSKSLKRFHCLGMTDGPNEIDLLSSYHGYIRSWDSSAATWAGLNGIKFDCSPTGLMNGKFEKEVDFDLSIELTHQIESDIIHNINVINSMCNLK